ncbi:MAG: Rrf2 family transcriptional regulator [Gammaproteobacteria bacterium]
MKLSSRSVFAIKSMLELTFKDDSPISLPELSRTQNISLSYLEQIFAVLRKAGLAKSTRGPGGGYKLGKPAGDITVADIVAAIEQRSKQTANCESKTGADKLDQAWDVLNQEFFNHLHTISLAKLKAEAKTNSKEAMAA